MSAAEVIAYIGAAAWIPQIVTWVYQLYVVPQVDIVTGRFATIGYTRFGPIFNLNLGFFAKRKAALVDALEAVIVHEDGERHVFQMEGMNETVSDIGDASGPKATISKEQTTLAFRVGTEMLLERFVRFQERKFRVTCEPLVQEAAVVIQHERRKGGDIYSRVSQLRELRAIINQQESYFWWKAGIYEVIFRMTSPEKINVKQRRFDLVVTQMDVDSLRANLSQLPTEYENLIRLGEEGYSLMPVDWNWRTASITRKK